MKRNLVVVITGVSYLLSTVLAPATSLCNEKPRNPFEGMVSAALEIDGAGNVNTGGNAEIADLFVKGISNTEKGTVRGKILSQIVNESGERQKYKNDPAINELILLILIILVFQEIEEITGTKMSVNPLGKMKILFKGE